MFPVDTIKTRLQAGHISSQPRYNNVLHAAQSIITNEGVLRLYRGIPATVFAAIPSHALHYATYELCKDYFGGSVHDQQHHPIANGAAGAVATMVHDAIVTPLDVVKQRLQLCNSPYKSVTHCVNTILKDEGIRAFYASYPTTVFMNVPFMAVHFGSYESFKLIATQLRGKSDIHDHGVTEEILAGGLSGAMAGLLSNPFDVIKTRIQTQTVNLHGTHLSIHTNDTPVTVVTHGCSSCARHIPHAGHDNGIQGARQIAKQIYQSEGIKGFWRGATARVIYFVPSAAICWTTYETIKRLLKNAW